MIPASLQNFQLLIATAGTPKSLASAAPKPQLQSNNIILWPGKGSNGRTPNAGIAYVGFGTVAATTPNSGSASATITPPTVWIPIPVAPTAPIQLPSYLDGIGIDLALVFIDVATNGDGVTVMAICDPQN